MENWQGWQGYVALAVSLGTFALHYTSRARDSRRDELADLRAELERARTALRDRDEEVRELRRDNDRLMRRIALRDSDAS
jgi:predicted  nucleic acid-binding Zn-ribbon protein